MREKSEAGLPHESVDELPANREAVASRENTLREFARLLGQLLARHWLKQQANRCESTEPPCGTGS